MEQALRDMEAEMTCLLRNMHWNTTKREEHEALGIEARPTPRGQEELPGRDQAGSAAVHQKTWGVPTFPHAAHVRAPSPVQTSTARARAGGASPGSPPRRPLSPFTSPRSSWAWEAACEPREPRTPLEKHHSAGTGNFHDTASPRP